MKSVKDDPKLNLQIIATGMHLSPEFGLTYREILLMNASESIASPEFFEACISTASKTVIFVPHWVLRVKILVILFGGVEIREWFNNSGYRLLEDAGLI